MSPAENGAPVTTIDVDALRELLESRAPVMVLDLRSGEARSEWAIPGSVHVDASEALKTGRRDPFAGLALPADRPVITVCNRGNTSKLAVPKLRERGIQALSLAGGMKAWSLAWNVAEVAFPLVTILQLRRTGKGCLSYLVGMRDRAAVIDPSLDLEVYTELARRRGWTITDVVDTHVHADHLSRARPLALATGAVLHLPEQRRVAFAFEPVRDGDVLEIGPVRLLALRVPGHTLESTAFLLASGAGAGAPAGAHSTGEQALFTGDTLFLEGVGRPDLEASREETRERAHALHASLRRILTLSPDTLILPAHTSRPVEFDGKPLVARLQELQRRLPLLSAAEEEFVTAILGRIPPMPPNHHTIVRLNEDGEFPNGDPTDLEAGANRCAVSG